MISVIIPTMWRSHKEIFLSELAALHKHHLVGEIILIDNSDNPPTLDTGWVKVRHIKEMTNTFVNPAWNKGVRLAQYDKLLIMNDDVETNYDIIDMVYEHITEDKGMIGAGQSCWHPHYKGGDTMLNQIPFRQMCYGSLFFIHKQSYTMIPEDIKIWFGDDWLFAKSGKPNFEIANWELRGESSMTCDATEFNPVKERDGELYHKHLLNL
jgi:hypothetical protein